jgi:Mrp family chromosome partitioning ATPase
MSGVYEGLPWNGGARTAFQVPDKSRHLVRALSGLLEYVAERRNRVTSLNGTRSAGLDVERLASEQATKLARQLFPPSNGEKRRAVIFAGVERDNGCADICVRAGKALAALHPGSVCLVDANLRSPSLHELLKTHNGDGLATAVRPGHCATTFARPLDGETAKNLWVLPAGSSDWEPETLFTSARVKPRLRELCKRFDRVLICAPPADLHAESLALGQIADGVVLVVAANATRRNAVRHLKARLDALKVPVLGIVLNDRTFPVPEALYRLL